MSTTTIRDQLQNEINANLQHIINNFPHVPNDGSTSIALPFMIGYLLFNTVIICLMPRDYLWAIRWFALSATTIFLGMCLILIYRFDMNRSFQFTYQVLLIPEYNLYFSLGVDGLSLVFLVLTALIMPICIFACSTIKNYKQFIIFLFFIEIFLVMSFIVTNIIFYYVFFESVLVPMFAIIGFWGSRERKISASIYFVLYTAFGSFFLLYGIYSVYLIRGSLEYGILLNKPLAWEYQELLWIYFFIPFAIKLPMWPVHIWLPEAHVEAPTIGSVLLASLLLKLGGYGLLRFFITLFDQASQQYFVYLGLLATVSVIYASLVAMRQNDIKRVIAYSSIAHMNLIALGLLSWTHPGIDGAIYLMIGHGIVSAALFICVGVLYDRYHTRYLKHFSGLAQIMPVFSGHFFLFTLANMGFPLTSNFVGELLIFVGIFEHHSFIMTVAAIGIVLSAVYAIWLFNRVSFGTLKSNTENIPRYADLNRPEIYILVVLAAAMLALGLNAAFVTGLTYLPIKKILLTTVYKV